MEEFRSTLVDCNLYDLGFSEPWFTWERVLLQKKIFGSD